jgi:hypothetical protein
MFAFGDLIASIQYKGLNEEWVAKELLIMMKEANRAN